MAQASVQRSGRRLNLSIGSWAMTDEPETADRRGRGPEPIKRTVQRLFAEQVSCARPECPRRLFYELDGNEV